MSTSTAISLGFRCTKCWQLTTASSDQVGQSVPCICCSSPVVVPEANEKTLKAGEEFASDPEALAAPKIELNEQNLTHEQISALAREKVKKQIRQEAEESGSYELLGCSRWKRFFGSIIDSMAGVASVIVGLILAMILGGAGSDSSDPMLMVVIFLVPAMLAICQTYMIAVEGRTIGKYCVKSKIVNLKGQPPGFFQGIVMRIFVVAVLGAIPFFGMVNALWIYGEPKRCLHDYIAGTFVIDA